MYLYPKTTQPKKEFKTNLVWSINLIWFITGFAKFPGQFSIGANTIEKLWKNTKRDSTDKKVLEHIFINVFDINIALGSPVNKAGQSCLVIINSV